MTREEIEKEIRIEQEQIKCLTTFNQKAIEVCKKNLAELEKQLAELEVEVYRGWLPIKGQIYWFVNEFGEIENGKWLNLYNDNATWDKDVLGIFKTEEQAKQSYDRHMAGEELKKIISEENAKQGWKVDWEDEKQLKYCIEYYDNKTKLMSIDCYFSMQMCENELYFSEHSAQDQDFLDKIKPLWLIWKGIE